MAMAKVELRAIKKGAGNSSQWSPPFVLIFPFCLLDRIVLECLPDVSKALRQHIDTVGAQRRAPSHLSRSKATHASRDAWWDRSAPQWSALDPPYPFRECVHSPAS